MKKQVKRAYSAPKAVVVSLKIDERLMNPPGWSGKSNGNTAGCAFNSIPV